MEREQATKFIYDLLRALIAKRGSDLFITSGFPPAMKIDSKMTKVSAQALPGLVAAIRELPGFPLETRTRVSVLGESQETLSTVTKILVGPQPAELFEVPAGWRTRPLAP